MLNNEGGGNSYTQMVEVLADGHWLGYLWVTVKQRSQKNSTANDEGHLHGLSLGDVESKKWEAPYRKMKNGKEITYLIQYHVFN